MSKKITARRKSRPLMPRRQALAVVKATAAFVNAGFVGTSTFKQNAFVIPTSRSKHGLRKGGKLQYAIAAIAELYPHKLPPEPINERALARQVNRLLAKDAAYQNAGYGWLAPETVRQALRKMRDANR